LNSVDVIAAQDVTLTDTDDIALQSTTIAGDLIVVAGGDITNSGALSVTNTTTLTAAGQDITMDQDNNLNNITIVSANNALLNNGSNNLRLNDLNVDNALELSAGAIIDGNGSATNVDAGLLRITAANGIASGDVLEIAVNILDASNTASGEVNLSQDGDVELVALKNLGSNGNITFDSDGDINFNPDSTVASLSSGSGDLIMTTSTGSFLGLGTEDFTKPDITARNATFLGVAGTFGSFERHLVLNVTGDVVINTRGAFDPQFVPPGPTSVVSTGIDFSAASTASAIAGEQLVEVESLSEVDPAIFTALRNYSQEEISIRMPRDQLYGDDQEADEEIQ
ncbi:MAG: hypothetical protein GY784_18325, partial [Gammaproteobacteria bacterium]|nr:hypothetical protein [Gammaproteobacteria bacterium]